MGFATEVGLDLEFLFYFLDVVDMTVGFEREAALIIDEEEELGETRPWAEQQHDKLRRLQAIN